MSLVREVTTSHILVIYKFFIAGINLSSFSYDQVIYSYALERKSKSWPTKVLFKLFTRLLMNSYIIYFVN